MPPPAPSASRTTTTPCASATSGSATSKAGTPPRCKPLTFASAVDRAAALLVGQDRYLRRMVADGESRDAYLRALGDDIAECEARWSVQVERAYPNLGWAFVSSATRADGSPCVLKIRARAEEIEALRLFGGRGAARVLELNVERRWLLMERLVPGTTLAELTDDEEATRIGARVMRKLWRPAPAQHTLETLDYRGRAFERGRAKFGGGTGPFPEPR